MIARLIVQTVLWLAGMGAVLFGAAGTLAWPGAWCYLFEMGALGLWVGVWLARHDPALLAERLGSFIQRGQGAWDKFFMVCVAIAWCGWLVLMGFDARRFYWSSMHPSLQVVGVLAILVSMVAMRSVFRANSYAAPVVKIMAERGHKVSDSGPYAYVRHPMYAWAILFLFGTPLLLGSFWGLVCVPLLVVGLAYRAVLEERMLCAQLAGYAEYAARVRYRFVPYVW
ncbi:methyltransferase family protein [Paraburkholderia hospita]|jgi:protein-S-isoprenylcysteine O-methyltransferase Ste14|uniref:methyltransferase family protein n=1 Tax=Paraburkholderia hospita TaxID=169430 RepID=UPI0009A5935C|nr:isoprenylcysteine carboxylmethyltransferase family protein [Paraburkholderia hospita]AXF00423.1 isoprenylcysteine carboxylmethyltransferase family protein [Paraburkholderia hospita]OUL81642.1 isoprenylcysteine carboxyl methyltransferase [Paraburkholderia hospita]SKC91004.1 Protein-S-isoprenylcysteine O-methyltransferase Ste14 [Paraburkholderia hospita]SOE86513.1 Protein-S-isoprenylcysteine O-methyltransferase Ste14 [Burkholderia sp. YR290]